MAGVSWERFAEVLEPYMSRLTGGISRQTELEAAGLDSLSLVELVVVIETEWDVELPLDALNWDTFATAGTLFDAVTGVVARAK